MCNKRAVGESGLRRRVLEGIGAPPAWHDVDAVEELCYALLDALIQQLPGAMG